MPYVELPSNGDKKTYRLPLGALIQSLSGNYDLLPDVRVVDEKAARSSRRMT